MEVLDAIYTRRAVREFIDKKIDKRIINKIIDAGIQAPSACDIQGWKFIVIEDRNILRKIIDTGATSLIKNAPTTIFVLYDNRTDNVEYEDNVQSAAACIQNMFLTAHNFNLGCCWVCNLPLKKKLRKILEIPSHYDPIACILLGYSKKRSHPRPRKYKLQEIISYNRFMFKEKRPLFNHKFFFRKTGRRIYHHLPFKKLIKPLVDKKFEKKFD